MKNKIKGIEKILERFDERIIELRKKAKEFPSRAMEGLLPILEEDNKKIKKYFRKELSALVEEERTETIKNIHTFIKQSILNEDDYGDLTIIFNKKKWNRLINNLQNK
jgi:hypothetical protein